LPIAGKKENAKFVKNLFPKKLEEEERNLNLLILKDQKPLI
jgi:hypothetical protein